jgi:DnaJ-class molecular chaperone
MSVRQTHYEVLELQENAQLTPDIVKQAYHRALLKHHPDKAQQATARGTSDDVTQGGKPTIDGIVVAYTVLSDGILRKSYDSALRAASGQAVAHRGIDLFDLDDMQYSEVDGHEIWRRDCRCDSKEGYVVTGKDLERADKEQFAHADGTKELLVPCRGCSLFIRVSFAVSDG